MADNIFKVNSKISKLVKNEDLKSKSKVLNKNQETKLEKKNNVENATTEGTKKNQGQVQAEVQKIKYEADKDTNGVVAKDATFSDEQFDTENIGKSKVATPAAKQVTAAAKGSQEEKQTIFDNVTSTNLSYEEKVKILNGISAESGHDFSELLADYEQQNVVKARSDNSVQTDASVSKQQKPVATNKPVQEDNTKVVNEKVTKPVQEDNTKVVNEKVTKPVLEDDTKVVNEKVTQPVHENNTTIANEKVYNPVQENNIAVANEKGTQPVQENNIPNTTEQVNNQTDIKNNNVSNNNKSEKTDNIGQELIDDTIEGTKNWLGDLSGRIEDAIKSLTGNVGDTAFDIKSLIENPMGGAKDVIGNLVGKVASFIVNPLGSLGKLAAGPLVDLAKDLLGGLLDKVNNFLFGTEGDRTWLGKVVDGVKEWVGSVVDKVNTFLFGKSEEEGGEGRTWLGKAVDWVKDKYQAVNEWVGGIIDTVKNFLFGTEGDRTWLGKAVDFISDGINAVKEWALGTKEDPTWLGKLFGYGYKDGEQRVNEKTGKVEVFDKASKSWIVRDNNGYKSGDELLGVDGTAYIYDPYKDSWVIKENNDNNENIASALFDSKTELGQRQQQIYEQILNGGGTPEEIAMALKEQLGIDVVIKDGHVFKADSNGNILNRSDGNEFGLPEYSYQQNKDGSSVTTAYVYINGKYKDYPTSVIVRDKDGNITSKEEYAYDKNGNCTSKTEVKYDANGKISKADSVKYDEKGNVTERTIVNNHYNEDGSLKIRNTVISSDGSSTPDRVINTRPADSMDIGGNTTGKGTIVEEINPKTGEYVKHATDSEGNKYFYNAKGDLTYAVAAGHSKDDPESKDFTKQVKENLESIKNEVERIKAEERAEKLNNLSDNLNNGYYGEGANFRKDDFIRDWKAAGGEHYNFSGSDAQQAAELLKQGLSLDEVVRRMKNRQSDRQNYSNNSNYNNSYNSYNSNYNSNSYSYNNWGTSGPMAYGYDENGMESWSHDYTTVFDVYGNAHYAKEHIDNTINTGQKDYNSVQARY